MNAKTNFKPRKKSVIFFFILFVSICIGVYVNSALSTPYKISKATLAKSNEISSAVGIVKGSWLYPFGISIKERGDSGSAKFSHIVTGDADRAKVSTALKKTSGIWQVTDINIIERKTPTQ